MAVTTASLLFTGTTTATTIALGGTLAWGQVVVGGLVFSAATSVVTNALMPKPDVGGMGSNGTQTNFKSTTAPHDIVYGETRKGGAVTYMETTDTNKYLHMIVVLAGHEVNSIESIYINDKVATIDGNGLVTSVIEEGGSQTWDSKIRIFAHTGAQTLSTVFSNIGGSTNTSSKTLVNTLHTEAENSDMSSAFIGSGLTYLYVRLEYDGEVFSGGIPTFTAKIKGKKVYDPRLDSTVAGGSGSHRAATASTWAWSANAALCVRDYLTSDYGVNSPTSEIDDASIISAANACVTVSVGSDPVNPFDINGVVQTSSTPQAILNQMMTACGGTLFWGQGAWKLMVGYQTPRTTALTLGDLRGQISLDTRMSRRDAFNIVQGQFADAAQDYITVDYPQYKNTSAITEDNSQESILDLSLPLTTGSATAQRLAKQTLLRNREQMTFSASFGIKAFDIQAGDIIKLTLARYGWTDKLFEVVSWSFGVGETTVVNLTLRETSSAAFSWVETDYSAITANDTSLPSPYILGVPVMQSPVQSTSQNYDGTSTTKVIFSWTAATTGAVSNKYEFRWKQSTETNYTTVPVSGLQYELIGLQKALAYNFQVRAVNSIGGASGWDDDPASSLTITSYDSVPPSAPTNVTATAMYQAIKLSWTLPTTNQGTGTALRDLSHFNIYRYTGSTGSPAESAKIAEVKGTEFVDTGLDNQATRYYYMTSEDLIGNRSHFTDNTGTTNSTTTLTHFPEVGNGSVPYGIQVSMSQDPTSGSTTVTQFNDALKIAMDGYFVGSSFTTASLPLMSRHGIYVMKFVQSSDASKVSIRRYFPTTNTYSTHATNIPNDLAVDGDIIALGTITGNKIEANYVQTQELSADKITSGELSTHLLKVESQLKFLDGAAYYAEDMTSPNDGEGIYLGNPTGFDEAGDPMNYAFAYLDSSSASSQNKKSMLLDKDTFELVNPTIKVGASTVTVVPQSSLNGSSFSIPAAATGFTVTIYGGGGGGGGTVADESNNTYSVGANGGNTTCYITGGVTIGSSVSPVTATGGIGGKNGSNIVSGGIATGGGSSVGTGGAAGASQSTGGNASGYGAGGGGAGSRPYGGWLNSGQDALYAGEGGHGSTPATIVRSGLTMGSNAVVNFAKGALGLGSTSATTGTHVNNGGNGTAGNIYITYTTSAAETVDLDELTEAKVTSLKNADIGTTYTSYNSTDRANNTWYQNTSGKIRVVTINSTGGGYKVYVNTSASTSGAMLMMDFGNGTGEYERGSVTFVVPNNSYYYGGRHTNTDSSWVELT
jgi:hypothetical protein